MPNFKKLQGLVRTHLWFAIKFGVVGIITAAIYFFIMWFASDVMGFGYILAVSVAYCWSTSFHYFANRHFTFSAQDGRHAIQFARYMGMWVANYLITIMVVSFFVERFGQSAYVGVCAAVVVTVFVGYFLSKYWVFRIKGVDL